MSVESFEIHYRTSWGRLPAKNRIIVDRGVTLAMMGKLAEDIDYSNFKNAAHKNCPDDWDYGDFLMSVWSEGLAMQK